MVEVNLELFFVRVLIPTALNELNALTNTYESETLGLTFIKLTQM